jgi:hypothetical protein
MRLLLVLLAASLLQSPDRPDFSGSWKMVAARSESPNQTPPVTDMTFVINQAADQIRLDITSNVGRPISITYPFVATPKLPADPPSADERRAYWDTNRLVLERGGTISGQTVSSRQALTLGPDGEMIVERLVIVQHGYTLRGARNYAAVKDIFTRAQ